MLDVQYTSNQHHVKFFNINFPPGLNPIRDYIYIYIYVQDSLQKYYRADAVHICGRCCTHTASKHDLNESHFSHSSLEKSVTTATMPLREMVRPFASFI